MPRDVWEPMPLQMAPMTAKLSAVPRDPEAYAFEIKWDGIRGIAFLENGKLRLQSRNLLDITRQYPELQQIAVEFKNRRMILDGEIVALDAHGIPRFQRLQNRMGLADLAAKKQVSVVPVTYMIFDILYLDDRLLLKKTYLERREILRGLALNGPAWQTPSFHRGDAAGFLEASRKAGLEGIMAKRLEGLYESGRRSAAWLKIKNTRRQECVVGGWLPGEGGRTGSLGSLLVGYYDKTVAASVQQKTPQKFVYAGKVGTGFTDAMLDRLLRLLRPLRLNANCFAVYAPRFKEAVYVEPKLVAEVEFAEWTDAAIMRHPSFKGLREDKDPRDVVREDPAEG